MLFDLEEFEKLHLLLHFLLCSNFKLFVSQFRRDAISATCFHFPCLKNPLDFMSIVTPIMGLATGLLCLVMDPWYEFAKNIYFKSSRHVLRSFLLMLFGGTLAFFMVLVEFVLISVTSAVKVTIACVGLLMIILGVNLFNWYKCLRDFTLLMNGSSME